MMNNTKATELSEKIVAVAHDHLLKTCSAYPGKLTWKSKIVRYFKFSTVSTCWASSETGQIAKAYLFVCVNK